MPQQDILEWIDSVLPAEVRASVEYHIKANTNVAQPLIKQLQALRAQLRENAYQKIYEARAAFADDLLKLTQSLTNLIHFSSVANEDTNAYVSLLRSVSQVTQKLSFFGDDDADGDGVKDGEEGSDPRADLELEVDDGSNLQDEHDETDPPAEDDDQHTDEVPTEDAPAEDGEANTETPSEDAPAEDGEAETEMTDDENGAGDETTEEPQEDFAADFEKAIQKVPKAEPKKEAAEEPAAEDVSEEDADESDDEEGKKKKGGFIKNLDAGEDETAESSTQVLSTTENKFRFAYLGLTPDGKKVRALVTDSVYIYQPAENLFGGDASKLDAAIRKLMSNATGYSATLNKLNELVKAKKLTITNRKEIGARDLRVSLKSEADKGQLGQVEVGEGTPWLYHGVGLQKVKNNQVCIWFEVGSKEYAAIPGNEEQDIDALDEKIQNKIKTLSYDNGLDFLIGLITRKHLRPIFVGTIA
jgi:hypothetical protein